MVVYKLKKGVTTLRVSIYNKSFLVKDQNRQNMLKKLEKLSKVSIQDIPFDKKVISLFCNTKSLKVTSEDIMRNTGSLGLGIFDFYEMDELLSYLKPTSLEELKNILKIDFTNSYKYTSVFEFLKKEKIKYRNINEKILWNEVLYAYYLGYYKYYYPLEFYKTLFEIEQYDCNAEVIEKGYESVRKRILEINDVEVSDKIIIKKKSIKEIAEEEGLIVALEILKRGFLIEFKYQKINSYYQVKLKKKEKKLLIIMNEEEKRKE